MSSRQATGDRAVDPVADGPVDGSPHLADDVVRRRAKFDVSRLLAGATGLRRAVDLARSELRRIELRRHGLTDD